MSILIISALFPPEPVVSAILSFDIATALSKKNAVTVISPKPSRPYGFQFSQEIKTFNFRYNQVNSYTFPSKNPIGRLIESYSFGKGCYKYIIKNHKDFKVIYANTWPLFSQYLIIKASIKSNIPIIIHVQDIYPESFSKKYTLIESYINFFLIPLDKYILRKASKVITISEKMKNHLINSRNIDCDKITVINNWQDEELCINISTNKDSLDKVCNPFTFMYLGNIGPVAGLDLLIKAFAKANLKKCRLVIAGSGSMKKYLEKLALNYSDCSIEFWSVPEGKVYDIQRISDVLILPIKKGAASSSIPSKLPSYMFSSKPIIACVDDDSDTSNAIKEAKCGWVIQPDNIEDLSSLMIDIFSYPTENLTNFGENGKNYAMKHYSKKNNLHKLISLITETVSL